MPAELSTVPVDHIRPQILRIFGTELFSLILLSSNFLGNLESSTDAFWRISRYLVLLSDNKTHYYIVEIVDSGKWLFREMRSMFGSMAGSGKPPQQNDKELDFDDEARALFERYRCPDMHHDSH